MKWTPKEVPVGDHSVYLDYVLHTDAGEQPAVVEEWSPHGTRGSLTRNNRDNATGPPRWLPRVNGKVIHALTRSPYYPMNVPTDLRAAQAMVEEELKSKGAGDPLHKI